MRGFRASALAGFVAAAFATVFIPAALASAMSDTSVVYPSASSATSAAGYAYDTCTAPSAARER